METTWAQRLREVGLRVTRPRLSVLDVLSAHPHADADTIVTGARAQHPTLSPQTVYGVLDALVSAVTEFSAGSLADDLCLVALRAEPTG